MQLQPRPPAASHASARVDPQPVLQRAGRRNPGLVAGRCAWIVLLVVAVLWRDDFIKLTASLAKTDLVATAVLYVLPYALLASLAVPGAILLTMAAGPLFGLWLGTALASCASTAGAIVCFLLSRHLLGGCQHAEDGPDSASRRVPTTVAIGPVDLCLLRLAPIVPFVTVNLLAGRSRLPLSTYWWITQLTMLPATFLLVRCGVDLTDAEQRGPAAVAGGLWPLLVLATLAAAVRWAWRAWYHPAYPSPGGA